MFIAPFDTVKNMFQNLSVNKQKEIANKIGSRPPIESAKLSDYLSRSNTGVNSLSSDSFSSWLDYNYKDLPEDYRNQLLNAFSAYSGSSFAPNLWQQIGENWFGDFSSRANFENTRFNNLNSSISEILNAYHGEQFSSPAAELARRKAAGLNDDISGGSSIGSGEPGDIALPENLPAPVNDMQSSIPEIGSSVAQVFSMAMSFAQSFQSLSAGSLQLASDKLGLLSSSENFLVSQISNRLTEDDIKLILNKDDKSSDSRLAAINKLQTVLGIIADDKRLPRSVRKSFKSYHGRLLDPESIGIDSTLYGLISDSYSNKKSAVQSAGDPFNRGGFEECLKVFGDHVQKTVYDVQKLSAKYETDRLSVRGDNGESLGTLAGKSDASSFTAEAYQKEFDSIVNKMWDDILYDLHHGKDKDAWWSKLLSFAIPVVRLWLGNIKIPSVSHTTTGKNSSTSFGF